MSDKPKIDPLLATGLKQARTRPQNFVFIAKGTDGALKVNKTRVPPKEIEKAKKDLGGGTLFRGKCFYEDGKIVFEMAKAVPGTMATQIKKVVMRDAGLTLKVIVRKSELQNEEEETNLGEEEDTSTQDVSEQDSSQDSEFDNDDQESAPTETEQDQETEQEEDQDQEQEEQETEEEESSEIPKAPPVPSSKISGDFKTRLQEIKPLFDKAMTSPAGKQARLDKLLNNVMTLAKVPDFPKALAALGLLEKRIQGLSTDLEDTEATEEEPEETSTETPGPKADPQAQANYLQTLKGLMGDFNKAKGTPQGKEKNLEGLLNQANALAKQNKFAEGVEILENLQGLVASTLRAAEAAQEIEQGTGFVNNTLFVKSKLEWDLARKTATAELGKFQKAVLGDPQTKSQVDFDEIQACVNNLPTLLADFDNQLSDALDAVANEKDPGKKTEKKAKAVEVLQRYQAKLDENPFLAELDKNDFGTFKIFSNLARTLEVLEGRLS